MQKTLKLFLAMIVFGCVQKVNAASGDRFGYSRLEVPRSSYTDSGNTVNVLISSAPNYWSSNLSRGGNIILRSMTVSGVNPSTITFYDTITFANNVSTMVKVYYSPVVTANGNMGAANLNFNILFSSGLMISKTDIGGVSASIQWDYTTPPSNGGVGQ